MDLRPNGMSLLGSADSEMGTSIVLVRPLEEIYTGAPSTTGLLVVLRPPVQVRVTLLSRGVRGSFINDHPRAHVM